MGKLDSGFDMSAFDAETRQNKRNVGSIGYLTQSGYPFAIPKTGFLSKIWLLADTVFTVTLGGGTAVLDPINGAYGIYQKIVASLNGSKTVFNASGPGAAIVNQIMNDKFVPEESGIIAGAPAHAAKVYAAGVGAGANTWRVPLCIPITPNDSEMMGGFLNMYEAVQATLTLNLANPVYSLTAGASPILVTGAATVAITSGQINVAIESFDMPKSKEAYPPMNMLHIITEQTQAIAAAGDVTINHPISNIYLQIMHQLVHNGAANSMFIDNAKLVAQRSTTWYDQSQQAFLTDQRYRYKRDLGAGIVVMDLFNQGEANYGGWRDVIDGRAVSEFQSIITLNSGITLGSNPFMRTLLRQLEPVVTEV